MVRCDFVVADDLVVFVRCIASGVAPDAWVALGRLRPPTFVILLPLARSTALGSYCITGAASPPTAGGLWLSQICFDSADNIDI